MILDDAKQKLDYFNKIGMHYNMVANSVYAKRYRIADPFHPEFQPYIIAVLISFDMPE